MSMQFNSRIKEEWTFVQDGAEVYPAALMPFIKNDSVVPPSVNFDCYDGITKITKLKIKIIKDKTKTFVGPENFIYHTILSSVAITTDNKKLNIVLHLFPILRIKKELPLLSITIEEGGNKFPVSLPEPVKRKITEYLQNGKSDKNFTGFQFVDFVNNVHSPQLSLVQVEKYQVQEWNGSEIRPGDAVILGRGGWQDHSALYLGRGCYLWHCGKRCLTVSTLDQMCQIYQSHALKIAKCVNAPFNSMMSDLTSVQNGAEVYPIALHSFIANDSVVPPSVQFDCYGEIAKIEKLKLKIIKEETKNFRRIK